MKTLLATAVLAAVTAFGSVADAESGRPTIVLVHGAFADASSWNGVIKILEADGYPVVAAANPLRSVKGDAQYVAKIVESIKTPVVLVGHSYGGLVISDAAKNLSNVKSLVFVAAFAPDTGETALELSGKFPGSTLGGTLAAPVPLPDGGQDLYIEQAKFPEQFAADLPKEQGRLMAATQRPVTQAALAEPAPQPAWKDLPSWFVYGESDKNIPPQAMAFMAKRADARETVSVRGASHVVMVSHPMAVARTIEHAASAK